MKLNLWGRIAVPALLVFLSAIAQAQTVSPIISEYHGSKAKGEFTVSNGSTGSFHAIILASSFDVDKDGNPRFRPLDPSIHLRLDSQSNTIGARQAHTYFYEVTCDKEPCWLSIYAVVGLGRAATPNGGGINVSVRLPHTVYLCEREKNCRDHVRRDLWRLAK